MNCPHCDFHFVKLAINDANVPDIAPLVCEQCGEISIFEHRRVRKANAAEMIAIKQSPAYRTLLRPVQLLVERRKSERKPHSN